MEPEITVFVCGTKSCKHVFDGPVVEFEDGLGATSTCSKCGEWAFDVAMLEGE